MTRIEEIKKAVEKTAQCSAVHLESVVVLETFRGQIVWEGVVEVFELLECPKARRAYGWVDATTCTVVLEIPPVYSPNSAVRASIMANASGA